MMERAIYLAGPLFGIAERSLNTELGNALGRLGHQVRLPQVQALRFLSPTGEFDFAAVAEHCYQCTLQYETMVAILDGPDVDSGTAMEIGIKVHNKRITGKGQVIGVRTDFRASEDDKLNAMFRLMDKVIYMSPFYLTIPDLAEQIHRYIGDLRPR
jgi:nucleoside 2-deoxyribosyltransferase